MSSRGKVSFHFLTPPFRFPERSRLKRFLYELATEEGAVLDDIKIIFCNDDYLLRINKEFLKHDTLTDIITFPLSVIGEPLLSEIYISTDRVRENAAAYSQSFLRELHRVIFHGVLHLCGYLDKSRKDIAVMREREAYYLNRYFVPRGTFNDSGNVSRGTEG
jgi:rRNA maturation RNase YbeY